MHRILVSFSRRAAFLCLALALLNLHPSTVLAADARTGVTPTGEITLSGGVHVDGAPAIPGQTLFPGSTFRVAAASHSTLALANHARLELSQETTLRLDFSDDQVTGVLKAGRLRVFVPAGVTARLMTADATVTADSPESAIFIVESGRGGGTTIMVEAGQVEMSEGIRLRVACEGQALSTAGVSETLARERLHFGGAKREVFLHSIVGVIAVIALILHRNRGGDEENDLNFGGTVCGLSPFAGDPCSSIP